MLLIIAGTILANNAKANPTNPYNIIVFDFEIFAGSPPAVKNKIPAMIKRIAIAATKI